DPPPSDTLSAHRVGRDGAVTLVDIAPVHLVRQLHAGERGADLRPGESSELLCSFGAVRDYDRRRGRDERTRLAFAHGLLQFLPFTEVPCSLRLPPILRTPDRRFAIARPA